MGISRILAGLHQRCNPAYMRLYAGASGESRGRAMSGEQISTNTSPFDLIPAMESSDFLSDVYRLHLRASGLSTQYHMYDYNVRVHL